MSAPDVEELAEALLQTMEWWEDETKDFTWEGDGGHWSYGGSINELAKDLVDGWDAAQDVRRRRLAGEFGPDPLRPPRWPDPEVRP